MLEPKDILTDIAIQKIDLAIIRLNNDIHSINQSIELLKEKKAKRTIALKRIKNINPNQIEVFGTSEDIITKIMSEALEE